MYIWFCLKLYYRVLINIYDYIGRDFKIILFFIQAQFAQHIRHWFSHLTAVSPQTSIFWVLSGFIRSSLFHSRWPTVSLHRPDVKENYTSLAFFAVSSMKIICSSSGARTTPQLFALWAGGRGFHPRPRHTKDVKNLLDASLLSAQHKG